MTAHRAITVTPAYTVLDGLSDVGAAVRSTPGEVWSAGLGALLDRVAPKYDGEGVLVLDAAAAHALKLPTGPKDSTTIGADDARAAGWLCGKPGPWTTFYGDGRPTLVVGVQSWPDYRRSPLTTPINDLDSTYRLSLWQHATGSAWRGTPGVAGLTVFRATCPAFPLKGKRAKPTFKLTGPAADELAHEAAELDFQPEDWARPFTAPYAHGYDATRMYLAAAQACELLAPWSLTHTGRTRYDMRKHRAGWWKVELGPWNHDRIPAPSGPGPSVRWVTGPTMALLSELQERGGPAQAYEIIDSYTADGRRILRAWAEQLEQGYQTARAFARMAGDPMGQDQDGAAVCGAVKMAYAEALGLMNRPGNSVYRPDWHHAVIAQARSNLWRRLWAVGNAEDRWPLEIKVDNAWYESDEPDPEKARPVGLPRLNARQLDDAQGTFKAKGTRERGRA